MNLPQINVFYLAGLVKQIYASFTYMSSKKVKPKLHLLSPTSLICMTLIHQVPSPLSQYCSITAGLSRTLDIKLG